MNCFFKPIRQFLVSPPIVLCLLTFLSGGWQLTFSQTPSETPRKESKQVGALGQSTTTTVKPPITLGDVLKVLSKEKIIRPDGTERIVTPGERNDALLEAVKTRGVAFMLKADAETRLRDAGATAELIDAIRRAAAKIQGDEIKINNIAVRYLQIGDTAAAEKKFDDAIDNYNQVIELDPDNRTSFIKRGIVYKTLGLNFKTLGDTAKQQKNTEEASKNYAEANKNYDKAIEDFSRAISIDPTARTGYYNRGVCYYEKPTNNNIEETKANARKAVDDFTKAIEIDAKFTEAYKSRANTYRYMLGESAKADADEQKIKEIKNGPAAQPIAADAKP
jgi:tetratricopeptide (TPR) repeat protein